ncbi:MAG: glutathione peroxidase, partial [Thermodesulfobacteriota bacterium]|nr:glutathione peroxidase [Thermodesulfobacteriota bacterium]
NTDAKVKEFCELTFGVNFPMTSITSVRGKNPHPFYRWAKDSYGSSAVPKWNFHKILIDKNGVIVDTYSSMTKPTDKKITSKINSLL